MASLQKVVMDYCRHHHERETERAGLVVQSNDSKARLTLSRQAYSDIIRVLSDRQLWHMTRDTPCLLPTPAPMPTPRGVSICPSQRHRTCPSVLDSCEIVAPMEDFGSNTTFGRMLGTTWLVKLQFWWSVNRVRHQKGGNEVPCINHNVIHIRSTKLVGLQCPHLSIGVAWDRAEEGVSEVRRRRNR